MFITFCFTLQALYQQREITHRFTSSHKKEEINESVHRRKRPKKQPGSLEKDSVTIPHSGRMEKCDVIPCKK